MTWSFPLCAVCYFIDTRWSTDLSFVYSQINTFNAHEMPMQSSTARCSRGRFFVDNRRAFFSIGFSDPINHAPNLDPLNFPMPLGLVNWRYTNPPGFSSQASEWENIANTGKDAIAFDAFVEHRIAPHGEPINPNELNLAVGHVHDPAVSGFRFSNRFDVVDHPALGHTNVGSSVAGSVALPLSSEVLG